MLGFVFVYVLYMYLVGLIYLINKRNSTVFMRPCMLFFY